MAENVVINIEADTKGLQTTIDLLTKLGIVEKSIAEEWAKSNTKAVDSLNKGLTDTAKNFDKVAASVKSIKADNNLAKGLDISAPMAKVGQSLTSLKTQLKEQTQLAQQYADAYGELDARTLGAAAAASELRQKIEDTGRVIKALDPGEKFNTIRNFAASIGGAFQVATGALQTFGVENEKATKIAQQFQGALNIFAGFQQLAELKDTFIALKAALGLSTVATEAQAVALEGEAVAAGTATTATQGLSASLTASGIGSIVLVIGLLATAFIALADNASDATQSTEDLKRSTDALVQSRKGLQDSINNEYAAEIKLQVLRGKITDEEGNRLLLQEASRQKLEENRKLVRDAFVEEAKGKRALAQAEKELQEAKKKYYYNPEAEGLKTAQANYDKEVQNSKNLEEVKKNSLNRITKDLNAFGKEFQLSKEKEVKDFKEGEEAKRKEAKKTAEVKPTTPSNLKTLYDDAVRINKAYYDELNLNALQSNKSQAEIDAMIAQNRINSLKDAIDTAKLYNQDYVQFQIELQKLLNAQTTAPPTKPTAPISTATSNMPDDVKKGLELLDNVKQQLQDETFKAATETLTAYFNAFLDGTMAVTEAQLAGLDEQEKNLQDSYDRRLIGKREFDIEEKKLNDKKDELEKKRKRDQAKADKEKALFDIALNTANAIIRAWIDPGATLAPGTIATILGIAGVQAAAVLAQPIPKFKKGTLSVGGSGTEDSVHALLQPGEAVIPTETNKRYHSTLAAIYHNKIRPDDINSWVNMRLRGGIGGDGGRSMTAKMDTADLYQLGRIMKKNDGVYIKNMHEFAGIFASLHNPRR